MVIFVTGMASVFAVDDVSGATTKKVNSNTTKVVKDVATDKKTVVKKTTIKKPYYKVLKTTKNKKVVNINGKRHALKKIKVYGRYTPSYAWYNKYYIFIKGARGTNGGSWKPAGWHLFENRVYSAYTKKAITKFGVIKVNPKKKSDGEFTCYNPGTRFNDMDFCLQTGREKWYSQRFYMKRIV